MKNGKKVTKSAIKMNIEYKICRNLAKISKFTYAKFLYLCIFNVFMHKIDGNFAKNPIKTHSQNALVRMAKYRRLQQAYYNI